MRDDLIFTAIFLAGIYLAFTGNWDNDLSRIKAPEHQIPFPIMILHDEGKVRVYDHIGSRLTQEFVEEFRQSGGAN